MLYIFCIQTVYIVLNIFHYVPYFPPAAISKDTPSRYTARSSLLKRSLIVAGVLAAMHLKSFEFNHQSSFSRHRRINFVTSFQKTKTDRHHHIGVTISTWFYKIRWCPSCVNLTRSWWRWVLQKFHQEYLLSWKIQDISRHFYLQTSINTRDTVNLFDSCQKINLKTYHRALFLMAEEIYEGGHSCRQ